MAGLRKIDPKVLEADAKDAVVTYAKEHDISEKEARERLILSGWSRLTAQANHSRGATDKKRAAPGRKAKA